MKRSEMLDIIYQKFDECLDIPNSSYLLKDGNEAAEHILKAIEEAGMLPPTTELNKIIATDNAWEEE